MIKRPAKLTKDDCLETLGGRVTAVSAIANNLEEAVKVVYNKVLTVHFKAKHYRRDTARKALMSETDANLRTLSINHTIEPTLRHAT